MLFQATLIAVAMAHARDDIATGCQAEGQLALTFDQGPSQYTGQLLATLAKHKVKATFHISPDYLHQPVLAAYLRRAANEGHLIGLWVKEGVEDDELGEYLRTHGQKLKSLINYPPSFVRFPEPGPTTSQLKILRAMGLIATSYNLDSQDYNYVRDRGEGQDGRIYGVFREALEEILPPSRGTFIAVQRDIVGPSVYQTDAIITLCKDKGYKLVRLDECIASKEVGKGDGEDGKGGEPKAKEPKMHKQSKNMGSRVQRQSWVAVCLVVVVSIALIL